MLKQLKWTENAVFSIRLRENLFSLAQMRKNHIMQFFDIQCTTSKWGGDLNCVRSLFFLFVAENRIKSLFVEKLDRSVVIPSQEPIPRLMLSPVIGSDGSCGANLVELTEDFSAYGARIVKENLSQTLDRDLIYRYELTGMVGDSEKLKNRLILFFDNSLNWDESKSFVFRGIDPPSSKSASQT